jgi:polysaccharide deacetylase 2 family uncharacterized protein YibQ
MTAENIIEARNVVNSTGCRMDRRTFLFKAIGWTIAGMAVSPFRRAVAMGRRPRDARMAVIIDDIGNNPRRAEAFLAIDSDLTYAVLPHLPYSVELAQAIHDQGREVLLHQPMEPFDRQLDPGPGALFVGDPAGHIESVVDTNIHAVPFATGVNNHMGSRFTSHGDDIRCALKAIKHRGLFFVDSLTTSQSKAYRTACSLHMSSGRRDTFLDLHRHPRAILNRLYDVMNIALTYGHAIAIGHPYPETVQALRVFFSETEGTPMRVVPVSHLLT